MNFAVIDTETTWSYKVMSIGIAIADGETQELITAGYYLITPECKEGGMYSDRLYMKDVDAIINIGTKRANKSKTRSESNVDLKPDYNQAIPN